MNEKKFVIILGDIHIGITPSTAYYQKKIHEKSLIKLFDNIIASAKYIKELILLGDIFEFWAYPPDVFPPTFKDIISQNPNILGPYGKLNQVVTALEGRVVFVPGDHDMMVSETDLKQIRNREGYTIKYKQDSYIPSYDKHILFTHGNEFTLLNSPFYESVLAPVPLGYFIARAVSYNNENSNCIKDIMNFMLKNQSFFKYITNSFDFINEFINVIAYNTKMPQNLNIWMDKNTAVSLNDTKCIYKEIFKNRTKKCGLKTICNSEALILSLIGDFSGTYLPFHARKYALEKGVDFVVAGHTDTPIFPTGNKNFQYANTGSMWASVFDMQIKSITCGIFDCSNRKFDLIRITDDASNNIQLYIENTDIEKQKMNIKDCQTLVPKENTTNSIKANEHLVFGWSVYNQSWEYYQIMQEGVLTKAKELGIEVISKDQNSNSAEMVIGCLELIEQNVDALIISPYNPEEIPYIVRITSEKEIPVVVIDGGTSGADVLVFIVSDSFAGGVLAGEYALTVILKYYIQSKNVAIIKAEKTATYALRRGDGFKGVMVENGYQIVSEVSANGERELAYEEMKKILIKYNNDLAVVFCENGNMTLGAAKAIEEAGEKGKIILIGFDADPSVLEAIKQGDVQGTIAQQPFKMGEIGVETANLGVLGEKISYDDWSKKEILMEVYLIDESGKPSINLR